MSTTHSNSDLFNVFIEAKQALDELPAVKAQNTELHNENLAAWNKINDLEVHGLHLQDEIDRMRIALAEKETALAAATFREQAATAKLDVLRSIIGVPEPVVVSGHSGSGSGEDVTSTAGEAGSPLGSTCQRATDPTVSSSVGETSLSANVSTENVEPSELVSGAGPSTHTQQRTLGDEGQSAMDPTAQETHSGEVSEFVNSSTSTVTQSLSAPLNNAEPQASASISDSANPRPHLHQGYWLKPDGMPWPQWISLGGDPAPWLAPDGNDPYHPMTDAAQ